jgi:uncharacterized membrane protein SirB2
MVLLTCILLMWFIWRAPNSIQIYSYFQKMQSVTVYLYLETVLFSGGTSPYHQDRIQLYLQRLIVVTPLLLSAAILEVLEQVWVSSEWRTTHIAH